MTQVDWVKNNLIAIIAVLLTLSSLAYGRIENNTKVSYDVEKILQYDDERQALRDRLTVAESDITTLRGFSLSYNKRLDNLEETQNDLYTEQRVGNEAMSTMASASKELSDSVKELTKVVERVAVLEERVKMVEEDNRLKTIPHQLKE